VKLRRISIANLNDILVFEDGLAGERAIFNHVCGETSCAADRFDTSINHLLNAHGIFDIEITDGTPAEKSERSCAFCGHCVINKMLGTNDMLIGCGKDRLLDAIGVDITGIDDDQLILGRIFLETKERATPCADYRYSAPVRAIFR
jgi:hypothetical protein